MTAQRSAGEGGGRARYARLAGWGTGCVVFALLPLVVTNSVYMSMLVFALGYMAVATAWNFFAYSGYISLGHGVFYGSGAYALTLLALHLHMQGGYAVFWLVPVAGLVAGAIAIPFGLIALRLRRLTFIVVTLAIFWVFQLIAYNFSFTGGSSGLQPPTPSWFGDAFNIPYYYVSLLLLAIALLLAAAIRHSRFGLQLLAINGDEDRARSLGVKTRRLKLITFVMSAVITGMAGAIWAYFIGQIFPQFAFYPVFDISVVLMVFFGGIGTLVGPLLGAFVLEVLQQYLTLQYSTSSLYLVIYGVLLMIVLLFMPRGVVPGVTRWLARHKVLRLQQPGTDNAGQPGTSAHELSAVQGGERR